MEEIIGINGKDLFVISINGLQFIPLDYVLDEQRVIISHFIVVVTGYVGEEGEGVSELVETEAKVTIESNGQDESKHKEEHH